MKIGQSQMLVLGPPGCGKTTDLLNKVERALAAGIPPNRIGFVSFTRKAILEAVQRACEKFNLKPGDFPFFKTIHSLCFMLLETKRDDMMGRANYRELGELTGYRFDGVFDEAETGLPQGSELGDKLLFLDNFARVTGRSLRDTWEISHADVAWYELERLGAALENYKKKNMLLDFTDLLARVVDRKFKVDLDVVFIDEAQDLSRLQWAVMDTVFENAKHVYIAGDDDQSIYKWSGADVDTFLSLPGERQLLSQSYRLPKVVYDAATRIIGRVGDRYDKPYAPRKGVSGVIQRAGSLDEVEFAPDETVLCLARNVYLLEKFEERLRLNGLTYVKRGGHNSVKKGHVEAIVAWERLRKGERISGRQAKYIYEQMPIGKCIGRGGKASVGRLLDSQEVDAAFLKDQHKLLDIPIWHDALENIEIEQREYYLAVLRRGGRLQDPPRVMVNTIHGVKGGEADHVVVLSDMSYRSFIEYQKDADSEHRVAYVGVTRSKSKLTLVQPQTAFSYPYQE